MNLNDLGFDDWFKKQAETLCPDYLNIARVIAVDREKYIVKNETGEVPAEVTGRLMFAAESPLDFPTVGDWVNAQFVDDGAFAVIHDILPRKSLLKRKTSGKRVEFQLIGANIDTALIMQSMDGNYSLRRLERYLVMVHEGGIHPLLLLSKKDLLPPDQMQEKVVEVQSKIKLRENSDNPERVVQVKVGMATCGIASGAKETMKYFVEELEQQAIDAVVSQTGCMGYCYAEPTVEVILPNKEPVVFGHVHKQKAKEIIDVYVKKGELIDGIIPLSFKTIDE